MGKKGKKIFFIVYTIVLIRIAGTAGYQMSEKKGQNTLDMLGRKLDSFRTQKGWDDLTEQEKTNAKYLFTEDEIKRYDNQKNFSDFAAISTKEPYWTFHYAVVKQYKKEQIAYGPVEHSEKTDKTKSRDELVALAKKQVSLDYTRICTYKDAVEKVWKITFYKEERMPYKEQNVSVYLQYDGTVLLVSEVLEDTKLENGTSTLKAGDD